MGLLSLKPLRIGPLAVDPPVLQAPMAGFTNHAYRQIVRRFGGVGLFVTEMVGARGFLETDRRTGALPDRLWGVIDEPRPLDRDPRARISQGIAGTAQHHVGGDDERQRKQPNEKIGWPRILTERLDQAAKWLIHRCSPARPAAPAWPR